MKTITEKYQASKQAVEMLNTAIPILKKLKDDKAPNYRAARQAFYDEIIPFVTENEIRDYAQVREAYNKFTRELGILTGIKGWI